jgi:hypothetical protein
MWRIYTLADTQLSTTMAARSEAVYYKEIGNRNATAISEKSRRFEAGNWFPD